MAGTHAKNKKPGTKNNKDLTFDFAAIFEEADTPPEGLTTQEIAGKLKYGIATARKKIKSAIISGKMIHNGSRKEPGIDGNLNSIPVYCPKN